MTAMLIATAVITIVGGPVPSSIIAIRVDRRVYVGQPAIPPAGGSGSVQLPFLGKVDALDSPLSTRDDHAEHRSIVNQQNENTRSWLVDGVG
ncbi:MAG TPA: hypothetical protein VF383_13575 [Candidatus Dormibacteraeota bacterium]